MEGTGRTLLSVCLQGRKPNDFNWWCYCCYPAAASTCLCHVAALYLAAR